MKIVSQKLLEEFSKQPASLPIKSGNINNVDTNTINGFAWLDKWAIKHAPELIAQFELKPNGDRVARTDCVWQASHGRDAYVYQHQNGAISAGCHHGSCEGKNWNDYRTVKEPGYATAPDSSALPNINAQPYTVDWKPPTPLEYTPQPEPPALDSILIPDELRVNCEDIAYRLQAPIEYAIICLIVMFATLIGHKLVIYAKRFDTWSVAPTIWGFLIGEPSAMKSPVLREVMGRLIKLDKRVFDDYLLEKGNHDLKISILQSDLEQLMKQKSKSPPANIQSQINTKRQEIADLKGNPPLLKRLVMQDATIEKAQEIMSATCEAALILWDEISTWFKGMNKSGHEGDRGFYLASWNGTDPCIVDRIGRGTIIIDRLGLSILGGIQSGVLKTFIKQSMDKFGNDGFMQRFQLAIFPRRCKAEEWQYTDQKPDPISNQYLDDAIEFLYNWSPKEDVNATMYRYDKAEFTGVDFDDDAQDMFKEWQTKLQRSLRDDSIDSKIQEQHYAKYSALMLKLALIFHVIKHVGNKSIPAKVGLITTARAIAWAEYLGLHADQLYSNGINNEDEATLTALDLLKKIKINKLKTGMTVSTIRRRNWSGLSDIDGINAGLELLVENGWVKLKETGGSAGNKGRPTQVIEVHPQASQYLKDRHQYVISAEIPAVERPWLERLQQLEDAPLLVARLLLTEYEYEDEDEDFHHEWLGLIADSI